MGRKTSGKKRKNQQKKQKKARKPSKGYPGIPQEQVTCREVAIYEPPDEDLESDDDDQEYCGCDYCERCCPEDRYGGFGNAFIENMFHSMMWRLLARVVILKLEEERMRGNRGRPWRR